MKKDNFYVDSEIYELTTLWVLRAIFDLAGEKELLKDRYDDVLEFLGIEAKEPKEEDIQNLKNRLEILEKSQISCELKDLEHNLNLLQENLGLNSTERDILRFVAIMYNYEVVSNACNTLGELNNIQAIKVISKILNLNFIDVQNAFRKDGIFAKTSIIRLDNGGQRIRYKIDAINNNFMCDLFVKCDSMDEIFESAIKPCNKTNLTTKNYPHIKEDVKILLSFLKSAISKKQKGVNVLLYGSAGTGKTELSKVIASELNLKLYEVAYDDEYGYATEDRRLRSYCLAQNVLSAGSNLLMYDEAEDIFNTNNDEKRQYGK